MSYLNTHLVKLISTLLRIFDSININILRMLFWLNLRKMKADWRVFFLPSLVGGGGKQKTIRCHNTKHNTSATFKIKAPKLKVQWMNLGLGNLHELTHHPVKPQTSEMWHSCLVWVERWRDCFWSAAVFHLVSVAGTDVRLRSEHQCVWAGDCWAFLKLPWNF